MSALFDIQIPITDGLDGYRQFIRCKGLPRYRVEQDEDTGAFRVETDRFSYAAVFGAEANERPPYRADHLFDYQRHVVDRALDRRRFAAYLDCGLGKTPIALAWAHAVAAKHGRVLYLCPLAVLEDTQRDCERFHGYRMSNLRSEPWTTDIAILNWESQRDPSELGRFAGIVLDEASIIKNGAGVTRKWLTDLAAPAAFRLALSATPSPNEQAEYATQAVWLGAATTLNEFYGQFFRKDGTNWRLKGHARDAFYRHLRSWCCYIQSPRSLGFHDCQAELTDPPEYVEINTDAPDHRMKGRLIVDTIGLGESRGIFGAMRADRTQPRFTDAVAAVEGKRSIVWCSRNAEEDAFSRALGGHVVSGKTPVEERVAKIDDWRQGRVQTLISKPSVLGFGVNLPEATDMLYSGYTFSFEQFYQAVRRAHRFGRDGRLRVHIPLTDEERPVWHALQRKMRTFDADVARLQETLAGEAHA